VYVGTVTGVWHGVRTPGTTTVTWQKPPFVNGLPPAAVQDLTVWQGGAASPRLLRAALQARGVWEVDLAAASEPVRTYLRVHPRDDRRQLADARRHGAREAVDGRLHRERLGQVELGEPLRVERADPVLQNLRAGERLLHRHLLVDREADEHRERVGGEQRTGRRRAELETAAIVGYTNAGKSTLLNALTGASVQAEQRVFATLDPTTRRLGLPTGREVLLTDTVGFIQKLPTDLVAAFRATLEEVTEADLIIQVLDVSSSTVLDQAATVEKVLGDLGAADKPRVVVLNKVDLLGPSARRRAIGDVTSRYPSAVAISATRRTGFSELLGAVDQSSRGDTIELEILVPYGSESVLAELRKIGGVERTEYVDGGTKAWGWVPRHAARRFEAYAAASPSGRA